MSDRTSAIRVAPAQTSIRALFKAFADGSMPVDDGGGWIGRVRPAVTSALDQLNAQQDTDEIGDQLLRRHARLVDDTLTGLLHMLSTFAGLRDRSTVAPLAAVAIGPYGRYALGSGTTVQVLFLEYEGAEQSLPRIVVAQAVEALWDLGFAIDHDVHTPLEGLEVACQHPPLLAALADRRFLWGEDNLFATLDAGLSRLLTGGFIDSRHFCEEARWLTGQ
jgi:UTP:GlnB (protein PII) uridylyltransferase